jgi:hypothetical protein
VNGVKGHGAQNTTFVIEIDSQRPHAHVELSVPGGITLSEAEFWILHHLRERIFNIF